MRTFLQNLLNLYATLSHHSQGKMEVNIFLQRYVVPLIRFTDVQPTCLQLLWSSILTRLKLPASWCGDWQEMDCVSILFVLARLTFALGSLPILCWYCNCVSLEIKRKPPLGTAWTTMRTAATLPSTLPEKRFQISTLWRCTIGTNYHFPKLVDVDMNEQREQQQRFPMLYYHYLFSCFRFHSISLTAISISSNWPNKIRSRGLIPSPGSNRRRPGDGRGQQHSYASQRSGDNYDLEQLQIMKVVLKSNLDATCSCKTVTRWPFSGFQMISPFSRSSRFHMSVMWSPMTLGWPMVTMELEYHRSKPCHTGWCHFM